MMVAVRLDRLGRIGLDRRPPDRPPDHPARELAGLEHQLRCPAQGGQRDPLPPSDDQLEAAARRVDRLARADPARDELPGVGDQRRGSPRSRSSRHRPRSGSATISRRDDLADRGADVRPELQVALPLVLGGGHDPGVEAHPAGDREDPLVAAGRRRRIGRDRPPAGHPEVQAARPAGPDDVGRRADRRGSRASRRGRCRSRPARSRAASRGPTSAAAASRTVPSPPTTTTRGASVADASASRVAARDPASIDRAPSGPAPDGRRDGLDDLVPLLRLLQPGRPRVDQDERRARGRSIDGHLGTLPEPREPDGASRRGSGGAAGPSLAAAGPPPDQAVSGRRSTAGAAGAAAARPARGRSDPSRPGRRRPRRSTAGRRGRPRPDRPRHGPRRTATGTRRSARRRTPRPGGWRRSGSHPAPGTHRRRRPGRRSLRATSRP